MAKQSFRKPPKEEKYPEKYWCFRDWIPNPVINTRTAVSFPRFISQGAKNLVGSRSLVHTLPPVSSLATSQPLCPTVLVVVLVSPHGHCWAAWSGSPLEMGHSWRDLSVNDRSLDQTNSSSLHSAADCTPVTLPWSWDTSQGLRFPAWTEKSFLTPGKEILYSQIRGKLLVAGDSTTQKSMWLIPVDLNCCPRLELRLGLAMF